MIDALGLALHSRGTPGLGPSLSSFLDHDIKELSYDLGVDPRLLKFKL